MSCFRICTYWSAPGGYKEGDANGDNSVDNKDLMTIFKYLYSIETTGNENALDINGDGKFDNKDLYRLFQYLSGYDVILN